MTATFLSQSRLLTKWSVLPAASACLTAPGTPLIASSTGASSPAPAQTWRPRAAKPAFQGRDNARCPVSSKEGANLAVLCKQKSFAWCSKISFDYVNTYFTIKSFVIFFSEPFSPFWRRVQFFWLWHPSVVLLGHPWSLWRMESIARLPSGPWISWWNWRHRHQWSDKHLWAGLLLQVLHYGFVVWIKA